MYVFATRQSDVYCYQGDLPARLTFVLGICSAPDFLSGIACCLAGACGPEDQQEATRFAKDYCELSGVVSTLESRPSYLGNQN